MRWPAPTLDRRASSEKPREAKPLARGHAASSRAPALLSLPPPRPPLPSMSTCPVSGASKASLPQQSLPNGTSVKGGPLEQDRANTSVPLCAAPPSFSSLYYHKKKKKKVSNNPNRQGLICRQSAGIRPRSCRSAGPSSSDLCCVC